MRKLLTKLQRIRKTLAFKIIIVICCVILPIIMLMLTISNVMINNLQDKLMESYRNQLALCIMRLDSQLTMIDQDMNRILSENWLELNSGAKSGLSDIEKYQFWKELKGYRSNLDLVDLCYIKTNWDNNVAITYNDAILSYPESDGIRQYLARTDIAKEIGGKYQMSKIGGQEYLFCNMSTRTYSFGFLIKTDSISSLMSDANMLKNEKYFLATKDGVINQGNYMLSVDLSRPRQTVPISGQDEDVVLLSYPSEKLNYALVGIIPAADFNSQIPAMEKILQIIAFLSIAIIPFLYYTIKKLVLNPLFNLNKALHQIENNNLDYRIGEEEQTAEFRHINRVFNKMASRINDLTIESYEKDMEKLDIEATNLRLQVNPHMLLNSLNMIYSLSQSKNYSCIQEFTLCLVDYFRYTLNKAEELVRLKDEMDFVNSYLNIQKIRFPYSFTCRLNIDQDLMDELVPAFLIQNFVENSIKYALDLGSEIEISVDIRHNGHYLDILVADTGNGMNEEILQQLKNNKPFEDKRGKHIGIWNCKRRLYLYYGDEASINIKSAIGQGTQVSIRIPMTEKEEADESVDCG